MSSCAHKSYLSPPKQPVRRSERKRSVEDLSLRKKVQVKTLAKSSSSPRMTETSAKQDRQQSTQLNDEKASCSSAKPFCLVNCIKKESSAKFKEIPPLYQIVQDMFSDKSMGFINGCDFQQVENCSLNALHWLTTAKYLLENNLITTVDESSLVETHMTLSNTCEQLVAEIRKLRRRQREPFGDLFGDVPHQSFEDFEVIGPEPQVTASPQDVDGTMIEENSCFVFVGNFLLLVALVAVFLIPSMKILFTRYLSGYVLPMIQLAHSDTECLNGSYSFCDRYDTASD